MIIKILLGILAFIFSQFFTILVIGWNTSSWKTSVDKDLENLKKADESFARKDDMEEIKESLKQINKNILEIFKNMPVSK